ncbi:MAG: lysophospholipid acyltransferase family protein [bacterium]
MSDVESFLAGEGLGSKAFYRFARFIINLLCRVFWRVRVTGRENIPLSGAFVLAPVHRSNIDTMLACTVTPRRMRYMGKDSLWKNPVTGWLFSALGGFPVTRGTADREALRRCVYVLQSGQPLVMFPEGERKSGAVVEKLFDGAVYVAIKANVPIIPVGIGGSGLAMQKGSKMIRPVRCAMVIGKPIDVGTSDGTRTARSSVKTISEELQASLQSLFDAAQKSVEPRRLKRSTK